MKIRKLQTNEIDKKILLEYLKDSRTSSREIARRIRVSVGTVLARTKKMEEEGLIKAYSAILNYEKLGYELTAITEITVSKGRLLEMEKAIAELPMTCAVYDVTGLTDAMIIAKFRNREELSDFTKTLLSLPFVERTNTHMVLRTVKEDFRQFQ